MKTFIFSQNWFTEDFGSCKVVLTDANTLEQFVISESTKTPVCACIQWLDAQKVPARVIVCSCHEVKVLAEKVSNESPAELLDFPSACPSH